MSDSSKAARTDAYGSKDHYGRQDVVDNYDRRRFVSCGERLFDKLEKDVLLKCVPPNRQTKILECGTGTGRFAAELAMKGYHVTATDASQAMLEKTRQRISIANLADRVTVRYGDIYNLDFADGQFDFVFCIRVLNQLADNADKRRAIAEMARTVAPGGLLLFDIVNRWSLAMLRRPSWHISPPAVRRALRKAGCEPAGMIGGLIFTQTMLEILPGPLAAAWNSIDKAACRLIPAAATRVYFLARKQDLPTDPSRAS